MRDAINEALKAAIKSQDRLRMGTLRLVTAALKERDIEARTRGREAIGDDELLALLAKLIRQREESAAVYAAANRLDLAEKERNEAEIIRSFLPKQMSPEETEEALRAAVAELGATSPRDMGRVMGMLKERYPGRMDFGRASAALKEMLR